MKRILRNRWVPLIAILSLVGGLSEAKETHLSVAVFDFVTGEERGNQGSEASNLLTGLLSTIDGIILVERAELDTLLGETELNLSGAISSEKAIQVGQLTGANVIITGRMFASGNQEYLVGKVISTETSRVFGASVKYGQNEGFASGVEALQEKLATILKENRDDLIAEAETPEERVARLRKLVGKKKLPRVYVEIPEEHVNRDVPDPAAETEIQKTLQDVGFPLSASIEDADVVIRGEAFSEAAGRRAGLISCRARVEIQMTRATGDFELLVDRQTSMAIDLTENIAAKSALQAAGSDLAERLVPVLASP